MGIMVILLRYDELLLLFDATNGLEKGEEITPCERGTKEGADVINTIKGRVCRRVREIGRIRCHTQNFSAKNAP